MLIKTEALVLRKTAYAENSAIVHVFTQTHGVLSFIFSSVQGKKGKGAALRPGCFIELVFYYKNNQQLLRAKETKAIEPFLIEDPVRSNIALLCTELVKNSVPDEMPDENLFTALKTEFSRLYRASSLELWFIHKFIIKLCEATGHSLISSSETKHIHTGMNFLFWDKTDQFLIETLQKNQQPEGDRECRRKLAEKMLDYMKQVVFPGKEIRTFRIISEVFDA